MILLFIRYYYYCNNNIINLYCIVWAISAMIKYGNELYFVQCTGILTFVPSEGGQWLPEFAVFTGRDCKIVKRRHTGRPAATQTILLSLRVPTWFSGVENVCHSAELEQSSLLYYIVVLEPIRSPTS